MKGMGGHQGPVMGNDEWLTPPELVASLGEFDLDPCAPIERPWPTAARHYTVLDNGLLQPWFGRVWCNPPYGKHTGTWLNRLALHGTGTALIFARTETAMFFDEVWNRATALRFLRGRVFFHYVDGRKGESSGGAPSVLVAYGERDALALEACVWPGHFVRLREGPHGA